MLLEWAAVKQRHAKSSESVVDFAETTKAQGDASPYPDAAWFILINFKWWSFNRTSKFQKMTEAFTTWRTWAQPISWVFPPHLGKVHSFIIFRILWEFGTHEAEKGHSVFLYIPTKGVCLDISIFLGGRNILYLFVLLHGCCFGECTQENRSATHGMETFQNLGLSRTNKNKTNTASCSGWT